MQNNNLGLTFVIGQLVENSIQAKATGTSNDEDGNANLLAAVALTNMYINSNINNISYICIKAYNISDYCIMYIYIYIYLYI